MKLKLWSIFIISLLVQSGCSSNNEHIIHGRSLGVFHSQPLFSVFVEDNIGGGSLQNISYGNNDFDVRDYEVEAYNIEITENTKFILDETGEELAFDLNDLSLFYSDARLRSTMEWLSSAPISVKIEGDFTQTVSKNRRDYITYSRELLPIYQASEVRLYPLSVDEFIYSNLSRYGHQSIVVVFDDYTNTGEEMWEDHDRLWTEINEVTGWEQSINLYILELSYFQMFNVPESFTDYPVYYIFDENGIILDTDNWEDVLLLYQNDEEE
ncbi:hypothetical protein [Evansella tamaricis]|uniref:Uncharacterized protein n=1 Tax=Evansella tamaricis TaxID=2069301 RepID=A0ABS6JA36_9BACI|nr:hypothetical protein [Evansella tamaricis]MBU9710552.1 hypothetical protein [Evansella tamaricis]